MTAGTVILLSQSHKDNPEVGCFEAKWVTHTVVYNACSPCSRFYFKGLRAQVELSETEVRLAKKFAQCDSTDDREETLGRGQPPS